MRRSTYSLASPVSTQRQQRLSSTRTDNWSRSRLAPPPPPSLVVRRERLLRLLDAAVHRRITLVVAPTVYGKTTLVAQWVALNPNRRIAWLTADVNDNDPVRFEQQLRAALLPAMHHTASNIETLARRGDPPVVLVLDDVHSISNENLFTRLATDLDAMPALRVILISRSDPTFPAYRFRLRDQVAEVRQRDLALNHNEARELLLEHGRKPLTDSQIETLLDRTDGWAAGVHMAAAAIRSVDDVDQFVRRFGRDNRNVADYLTDHLLHAQPSDAQRFLTCTSVLDRISASLCDFVLGTKDSRTMLLRLERAGLMIEPSDESRTWFHYHRLLRVLLRQHLRAREPASEPRLLERAADWHLAHDHLTEAVTYLAEAGSWVHAVDVILTHASQRRRRRAADPDAAGSGRLVA